ncbi:MAG: bifunctional oligoribonuclease/PAP phosphatase NrnA [candidate division Zixibacteria bacterium]|nr:bifunctional oligoribonuclease/PAP phosphatase NrnA [candidate division Zixibacteria bacterium]
MPDTSALVSQIRDAVERSSHVLVVSHVDPDGDALGSQLAMGQYLRDLGKTIHLMRDSQIPDKYAFLPGVEQIMPANSFPKGLAIDTAIILECPTLERVGSAAEFLTDRTTVISIDHHRDSMAFGAINWVDIGASSVGEMVSDYFGMVGYVPSRDVATQLYTAILTDSGRFRYQSTTAHTMRVAASLMEAGADPRWICDQVYYNMRPTTIKLIGRVLNTVEFHDSGRICMLTLTKEMFASTGAEEPESDGLVDFTMANRGVVAGILLKEANSSGTKVSLRSSNGVNVSAIAAEYGGGGHFNAAGCTIPKPMAEVRVDMIKRLTEELNARS